ncbi:MAG: amidohydrolase [Steroidobacteraceae bacterium]
MPIARCALALLLLSTPVAESATQAGTADLILLNGHVLTVDAHDSVVEAVAIRAGRIVAVGSNSQIRAQALPAARIIDLQGRTATPGLIDSHAHIAEGGVQALYSVELSDSPDIAEVKRRIARRAATLKPGDWLVGRGWDEGKLADHRYIVARDLDEAAPQNPVWLEHTTGHYGVANSQALKLAGIGQSTPEIPGGTIDKDGAGRLTGVLKEGAQQAVTHLIPEHTVAEDMKGILASLALMNREGMTAVKDPAILPAEWQAYESLDRSGKLTAHVCVLWPPKPTIEGARATLARLRKLPRAPRAVHENLVSCGVKYFMDGSGGARTAWMYSDWNKDSTATDTGNKGYPLIDPAVYRAAVRLFSDAGIHVATHAIGDRAIDWVVDTYAQLLRAHPDKHLRHAIIHANTPTDHAIDVMVALQRDFDAGYPETQAPFTWWIGDNYAGNLGPARAQRLNPYHTYIARGIRWGGGSDYPVTPLPARYGLWASVARTTVSGRYGAQPFGTAESVDIGTALKSYTLWAAHELFLDAESGSLEPGKSADIAVWDQDMTAIGTAQLPDLKCVLTLFRGKVVYDINSRTGSTSGRPMPGTRPTDRTAGSSTSRRIPRR